MDDVPAEPLQGAAQDDRGRDAVDVVVAVDRDALAPLDRREQAIDRGPHVGEQERVVELIERGVQEPARGFGVGLSAEHEQPGHDRFDAEGRRQSFRRGLVGRLVLPDQRAPTAHGVGR